jgi:Cu-Zn family superoxide dismutase
MKLLQVFPTILAAAALLGCQSYQMHSANKARAVLDAKSGSNVTGAIDFTERDGKVLASGRVAGLKPNAAHGFHIHEKGDCSAPDAMSAGGHFNPDAAPHGGLTSPHHTGDMGNLMSDGKGEAVVNLELDMARLDNGKHGILDRAVVVHANPDDFKTQPTGNSGGRIACGLIKKA